MTMGHARAAWWLMVAVLMGAVASGCAPKRVVAPPVATVARSAPGAESPGRRVASGRAPAAGRPAGLDAGGAEAPLGVDPDPDAEPAGPPVPDDLPDPWANPTQGAEADPGVQVAALARTQVGKPYAWGATGPERFDCSGLALYVYRQLGIALPRVSLEQAGAGVHVERSELKPGDLVFFSLRGAFDHVGIFLGNNRFVHAPRRREPVRVDNLDDAWWNRAYRGARRVFGAEP